MSHRKRHLYTTALAVSMAIAAAVVIAVSAGGARPRTPAPSRDEATPPPGAAVITISTQALGHVVPPGFLGLSLEFPAVTAYAGTDPTALNPRLLELIKALTPGQRPVLRIGGDSTDWTWWPTTSTPKPPGVRITLTRRWLQVTNALQQALNAKLIVGIDLEADNRPLAAAEASALTSGVHGIIALEPGNEPELYPSFGWYRRAGRAVPGRPPNYDFAAYARDFAAFAGLLHAPLAGPATGSTKWMAGVPGFVRSAPNLSLVTLHRYPLQRCYTPPSAPIYPTTAHLLSTLAAEGLAQSVAPDVAAAHAHHLPVRIDEMNTISCGNSPLGHASATALWAADALFAMADAGVDGVNIHTYPGATYSLFSFHHRQGTWTATVAPEYYGLLLFAHAAPPNSRLLRTSTRNAADLKAWATEAADGTIRLLLINDNEDRTRTVAIPPTRSGATIERLSSDAVLTAPAPLPHRRAITLAPLSAALITY